MWELKNKFLALSFTLLIVMAGFGAGCQIAAASTDGNTTPTAEDTVTADTDGDYSSGNEIAETVANDGSNNAEKATISTESPASLDSGDNLADKPTEVEVSIPDIDNPVPTSAVEGEAISDSSVSIDDPVDPGEIISEPDKDINDNSAGQSSQDPSADTSVDSNVIDKQKNSIIVDSTKENSVIDKPTGTVVSTDTGVNKGPITDEKATVTNTPTGSTAGEVLSVNDLENESNLTGKEGPLYSVYYEESPEPHENINQVEINKVSATSEKTINVNFTTSLIVNNINFESTKSSGEITVIVEDLKDKSCLAKKSPAGTIYKTFNIWVESNTGNIKEMSVDFKIEKAWINAKKIDKSTIVLNEYINGEWVKVPLSITSNDAKYIYCTAKVSGYSSFAITGEQTVNSDKEVKDSTEKESIPGTDESNQKDESSKKNEPKKNMLVVIYDRILIFFSGDDSSEVTVKQTTPTATSQTTGTPAEENLTVRFLDVGQGDSILLEFNGKSMLIDAGESDQGEVVSNYLKSEGISNLDYVVATHPHSDHIGGMIDILNNFQIDDFVDSGYPYESKTYENMLITIDQKGNIPFQIAQAGQTIDFDPSINIEVLNPGKTYSDEVNENSVALKVTYGETSFLLMGDAGLETEERIMESGYDMDSDILKVGHHGSISGSGEAFISAVSPEVSVIEVGAGNEYGHPHTEVLGRLQQSSEVYRTDLDGTITVTTDGSTYSVSSQKTGPIEVVESTSSESEVYSPTTSITTEGAEKTKTKKSASPGATESTVYVSDLNLEDEWVKISNSGNSPVSLTGWKIEDEGSKHTYNFPSYTLNSGSTVTVYTTKGTNSASELYWQFGAYIWNNDGDTAFLYDSNGKLISELERQNQASISTKKATSVSESTKEQVITSDTKTTTTSSATNTDNSLVYASSKSDVYHDVDCSYVDRINQENLITFKSRQEAEKAGYKACKKCGG